MTNKFKGLDLIDRVPKELYMEVHDIVQEALIKTIPKKKKCKKAKLLSDKALQIDEKGREAKGKGEKERHTHVNAEFQRLARRDKKAFLSDQCKETEENNIGTQYASKFRKHGSGHKTGKGQFSFQSQRKTMPKMFKLLDNSTHLTH